MQFLKHHRFIELGQWTKFKRRDPNKFSCLKWLSTREEKEGVAYGKLETSD
jgi:hypothetical protein